MSDSSRHSAYSVKRLPRQKRSLRVYGEREDAGKWYRCWNCGFINNIERNTLLDSNGYAGHRFVGYSEAQDTTYGGVTLIDEEGIIIVASEGYYPVVTAGCSFCGCTNYK